MEAGEDIWDVGLLGCSFLECLRGTHFGKNSSTCAASREVWNSALGGLNSHVLALAGAGPLLTLPLISGCAVLALWADTWGVPCTGLGSSRPLLTSPIVL